MSDRCCPPPTDPRLRDVLWIALGANLAMFAVEVASGLASGSVSLLADAVDFAGDAANYGISLAVLSLGLAWQARAAIVKAATMGVFGVAVIARAAWAALNGTPPEAVTMGVVGALALAANLGVAALLYRFRGGDANLRSVWLCTRNDVIGNLAVLAAALGVLGTGSVWPDIGVAAVIALLAVSASFSVLRQARSELAHAGRR